MVSSPAQEVITGLQSNFAITKIKNKKENFRAMTTARHFGTSLF